MGNLTLHNEMSHKNKVEKVFFSIENFCNELQRCNSKENFLTTKNITKIIVKNSRKKMLNVLKIIVKTLAFEKKLTINYG